MLRYFLEGLCELIYPKACLVCKRGLKGIAAIDELICTECWQKIKRNVPPFCHRCGKHLEKTTVTKNICPSCLKNLLHFDRAFSPCVYEGVIKALVQEFKYKNKDYLGFTLSKLMIEFIKEYHLPIDYIDIIVSVPLHKVRLREREFNQAQVLAEHIAREFNKTVSNDALRRIRYTKTQTDLEESERLANVRGSFTVAIAQDIKEKNILLIDDVLTTGATSSEAAYILKQAGANIVFVLALAN